MAHSNAAQGVARSLAPLLMLGSLLMVAGIYVNAQYPNLLQEMQYRFFGSSTSGSISNAAPTSRESDYVSQINALIISTRNKIDLREGRPFWGAATHMVEFAFRSAADDVIIRRQGARMYEFHRYGFGGNREPVVMEFANNALTCVHYPSRQRTACSPGAQSFYAGQAFPFPYQVTVAN